jgi:hypothetical protein
LCAFYVWNPVERGANRQLLQNLAEALESDKVMAKGEGDPINASEAKFEVIPAHYTAQSAADGINRAINAKSIHSVQLGGKYSGDTRIAKDPQTGMNWLIKPGSEKISPAQGIAER